MLNWSIFRRLICGEVTKHNPAVANQNITNKSKLLNTPWVMLPPKKMKRSGSVPFTTLEGAQYWSFCRMNTRLRSKVCMKTF